MKNADVHIELTVNNDIIKMIADFRRTSHNRYFINYHEFFNVIMETFKHLHISCFPENNEKIFIHAKNMGIDDIGCLQDALEMCGFTPYIIQECRFFDA